MVVKITKLLTPLDALHTMALMSLKLLCNPALYDHPTIEAQILHKWYSRNKSNLNPEDIV